LTPSYPCSRQTEIATITYRSGPEWETRFGRRMLSEKIDPVTGARDVGVPSLSPDFLIETYLDHQVRGLHPNRSTAPGHRSNAVVVDVK
jgi:homoserine acetyltransferase